MNHILKLVWFWSMIFTFNCQDQVLVQSCLFFSKKSFMIWWDLFVTSLERIFNQKRVSYMPNEEFVAKYVNKWITKITPIKTYLYFVQKKKTKQEQKLTSSKSCPNSFETFHHSKWSLLLCTNKQLVYTDHFFLNIIKITFYVPKRVSVRIIQRLSYMNWRPIVRPKRFQVLSCCSDFCKHTRSKYRLIYFIIVVVDIYK